ncbi:DUF4185 domain-containing protein [Rhodococcus sp. (in: high G+C Gram-positive bacteria)]|uniref:DUF4185 domain-containing protein n=1 Tax=Rhodococcus sp. TaxID=1831 RepID=UPI003B8A780D
MNFTSMTTAQFVRTLTGGPRTGSWGVGGTDLAFPIRLPDGRFGFFCGDTFQSEAPGGPGWRSPVMLRSHTTNLDDGIVFSSAAGGGYAKEILPNAHDTRELPNNESPGTEFTIIPGDAITIGSRTYLSVMSVHSWSSQDWSTNFTYLAYSDDSGENWNLSPARWDNHVGALNQMWTMERFGGYVYVVSTAFGRNKPAGMILRRVPEQQILHPAAYQDWGWTPDTGWAWGNPATPILPGPVGEMCLRYVQGTWVLAYFDPTAYAIVTRTAAAVDGVWSDPVVQVKGGEWGANDGTYAQIYGGYIHPESTLDNLHLIISQWNTSAGTPYHAVQFRTAIEPVAPVLAVAGPIASRYRQIGAETGPLGHPTSNEYNLAGGKIQDFEYGRIYWTSSTGAWETYGLIGEKYHQMGGPTSVLGWPTSGEIGTPNGLGRFNRFVEGNIYFNPTAGTHAIYGAIFARWGQEGYENSRFGFPTSDEYSVPEGRRSDFQGGWIRWNSTTGMTTTS